MVYLEGKVGIKERFGGIKTFTLLYVTMICLNCDKEFESKRPTAKFCSDNCRVKHHRKVGKKDTIKPFQMQAIYNQIKDMLGKFEVKDLNQPTNQIQPFQQPQTNYFVNTQPVQQVPVKRPKSPQEWIDEKRELEDPELYQKWIKELDADPYLSSKQKTVIKHA